MSGFAVISRPPLCLDLHEDSDLRGDQRIEVRRFLAATHTGMCRAELLGITRRDFDLDANRLTVRQKWSPSSTR